jgi:hypothetical protein
MNRFFTLAIVATVAMALRADARACSPVPIDEHEVDPSM